MKKEAPQRRSYRHGNLRAALVEAGLEGARAAGPDAVVLREATRRVGVVPNAAYRHFADRDSLLAAVRAEAEALLAASMRQAILAASPDRTAAAARERLRVIGAAYLTFARREPGWFLTAFSGPALDGTASGQDEEPAAANRPTTVDPASLVLTPYGLLAKAMDDLVVTGCLDPRRRPGAEFTAWASVHGLAMLLVAGPLRHLGDSHVDDAINHLLQVVDRGLTAADG